MFRFKRSYLGESVYLNAPLFSISNYHHIVPHVPKSHMTETTMIGASLSFSVFSSSWKFPRALKKKSVICVQGAFVYCAWPRQHYQAGSVCPACSGLAGLL